MRLSKCVTYNIAIRIIIIFMLRSCVHMFDAYVSYPKQTREAGLLRTDTDRMVVQHS
jgi:hypothetical protein